MAQQFLQALFTLTFAHPILTLATATTLAWFGGLFLM